MVVESYEMESLLTDLSELADSNALPCASNSLFSSTNFNLHSSKFLVSSTSFSLCSSKSLISVTKLSYLIDSMVICDCMDLSWSVNFSFSFLSFLNSWSIINFSLESFESSCFNSLTSKKSFSEANIVVESEVSLT